MTTTQFDAVQTAIRSAFDRLTDAEIAQLVMEPYLELRVGAAQAA